MNRNAIGRKGTRHSARPTQVAHGNNDTRRGTINIRSRKRNVGLWPGKTHYFFWPVLYQHKRSRDKFCNTCKAPAFIIKVRFQTALYQTKSYSFVTVMPAGLTVS